MNIKYAILGFLSWHPFTGYELKKIFADSLSFYWSGNNNQIYRTLVQLHQEGFVTLDVQYQENYPPRKVYTITDKGIAELRDWVLSPPELPEIRKSFLVQLAWADQLEPSELDELLEKYEHEVRMRLFMHEEQVRRKTVEPSRTPREAFLWSMISANWISSYENELAWVSRLRKGLGEIGALP